MKNPSLLILLFAILLGGVAWLFFSSTDAPPPPPPVVDEIEEDPEGKELEVVDANAGRREEVEAAPARKKIVVASEVENDPFFVKSLAGFKGRLVLTDGKPAADRPVQFYRIDPELMQNPHLFAEQPSIQPKLISYEGRSRDDGTFFVRGAFPQKFYLLVADGRGDNQRVKLVERTPGPGEVIDLGDITLPELGTITGRVVDMDGEPAVGAMVRAADLPGTLLDMAPVERFDPDGGLIVTEGGFNVIMKMPPWVRTAFDALPIPTTLTNEDGEFELKSVTPGMNSVVVNLREHVPLVRKGIRVRAGKTKKLGRVAMKEGEIAEGVVVDSNDEPVVGAEVMIASKNMMIPVQFGTFAKNTNDEGKFSLSGLAPGSMFVAVRRSKDEAWTIEGPVSVSADVKIKLPGFHKVTLEVKTTTGATPEDVEFRLCNTPGENGPGINLASLGMIPFIDVTKRVEQLEDGKYVLSDLLPGDYVVVARAKGFAAAKLNLRLIKDTVQSITLEPAMGVTVRVVGPDREPIRNARVYVDVRGTDWGRRVQEIPMSVGRTDASGEIFAEHCQKGAVRISATHPGYGTYQATAELPKDMTVEIAMQKAGKIIGVLRDGGKVPKPGKYTILCDRDWSEARGAMPIIPRMAMADLEGKFVIEGLAPGKYDIQAIPSVGGAGSPGGIAQMAMAQSRHNHHMKEVIVLSGGEARVELDPMGMNEVTGPSARVSGTVMINGRPGKGMTLQGWGQNNRLFAEVDAAGRFDLGRVAVGHFNLRLQPDTSGTFDLTKIDGQLWQYSGQIKENEDHVFEIDLQTGSVRGVVVLADGSPGKGMQVRASGMLKPMDEKSKQRAHANTSTLTDELGRFEFKQLAAGTYTVRVRGETGFGSSDQFKVEGGLASPEVRIQLEKVYKVSGKIDMSVYPEEVSGSTFYMWLNDPKGRGGGRGSRVDSKTGQFSLAGIPKGTYTMQISCWGQKVDNKLRTAWSAQPIEVRGDTEDLVVRPVFQRPKRN